MKKYLWAAALTGAFVLCAQSALCASTSRDEYFYDSRAEQPYRSPHNSDSLYSDGGTEDRAASDARRLRSNYESHARIRSSGSHNARSGGSWSVNSTSIFKYDRRSYGHY